MSLFKQYLKRKGEDWIPEDEEQCDKQANEKTVDTMIQKIHYFVNMCRAPEAATRRECECNGKVHWVGPETEKIECDICKDLGKVIVKLGPARARKRRHTSLPSAPVKPTGDDCTPGMNPLDDQPEEMITGGAQKTIPDFDQLPLDQLNESADDIVPSAPPKSLASDLPSAPPMPPSGQNPAYADDARDGAQSKIPSAAPSPKANVEIEQKS